MANSESLEIFCSLKINTYKRKKGRKKGRMKKEKIKKNVIKMFEEKTRGIENKIELKSQWDFLIQDLIDKKIIRKNEGKKLKYPSVCM